MAYIHEKEIVGFSILRAATLRMVVVYSHDPKYNTRHANMANLPPVTLSRQALSQPSDIATGGLEETDYTCLVPLYFFVRDTD